jgi:aromatic amino acid aminotransferase I
VLSSVSIPVASRTNSIDVFLPDVIIVEDDPYYFLQMPHYVPKETRKTSASPFDTDEDNYLRRLVPSYLK